MRLDKFLAENIGLTRTQAGKALRQGRVSVNGQQEKSPAYKVLITDSVFFEGEKILPYRAGHYLMFHKPEGYVCSHDESLYPSVLQFFDYPLSQKLHTAGRLDVDTTGLVLLTDDGQWSHRITSPKHHCEKTYLVTTTDPILPHYRERFAAGILLRGEKHATLPAQLDILDPYHANLTLTEGRYHQVKRMFGAMGNKVKHLHRWRIGTIHLDEHLAQGEWRSLTEQEKQSIF